MYFLTTPIYYVNARPHLGHAYTSILCDTLARYQRLVGNDVFFLTGTDEHGEKIVQAAEQKGKTPQEYVDEISKIYRETWSSLHITNDYFVRTTDTHHKSYVQKILQQLFDQGDIYLSEYEGTYCTGCERYITEKEMDESGNCLQHNKPPIIIKEQNYFFRMQKYLPRWLELLEDDKSRVQPDRYYKELKSLIRELMEIGDDLSISRPKSRLEWGIEMPFDKEFVTYVWFDALYNYISALQVGQSLDWKIPWQNSHHFIAKDILKPHGIYWPTMLLAAQQPVYKKLYVHGYWLGWNDQKMSKSLANAADPLQLADSISEDGMRYFLMREMAFGSDARFSEEAIESRLNTELANELGNLVQRSLSMLKKYHGRIGGPSFAELPEVSIINDQLKKSSASYHSYMQDVKPDKAIGSIFEFVRSLNQLIEQKKPWQMAKEEDPECVPLLRALVTASFISILYLRPFLPAKYEAMNEKFGFHVEKTFPVSLDELSIKDEELESWPMLFKRMELVAPKA